MLVSSRWLDYSLGMLAAAFLVLLFSNGVYAWAINGSTVYEETSRYYIAQTPHTLTNPINWVNLTVTNKDSSPHSIDVGLGFDTSIIRPKTADVWATNVAHSVPTFNLTCFTCVGTFGYDVGLKTWWCDNPVANGSYDFGYPANKTACWFTRNGSQTVYYDDWVNVNDAFSQASWRGKTWFYRAGVYFNAGETKTLRVRIDAWGSTTGKYDLAAKLSSDSWEEAYQTGRLVWLDPWWDTGIGMVANWSHSDSTGYYVNSTGAGAVSGIGNWTTLPSGSLPSWNTTYVSSLPWVNNSLKYDGGNDYAVNNGTLAKNLFENLQGAGTIQLWVWRDGSTTYQHYYVGSFSAAPSVYYVLWDANATHTEWALTTDGGTQLGTKISCPRIEDFKWTHLALTWDNASSPEFTFYINGTACNTFANASFNKLYSGVAQVNLQVGRVGDSRFFKGLMTDLRVWNYAMSSSLISDLYNYGGPLATPLSITVVEPTNSSYGFTSIPSNYSFLSDYYASANCTEYLNGTIVSSAIVSNVTPVSNTLSLPVFGNYNYTVHCFNGTTKDTETVWFERTTPRLIVSSFDETTGAAIQANFRVYNTTTEDSASNVFYYNESYAGAPTGALTIVVNKTGYSTRTYYAFLGGNESVVLPVYLLNNSASGAYQATINVVTTAYAGVANALVSVNKSIGGTSTLIGQGVTDSFGVVYFNLVIGESYVFSVTNASGYSDASLSAAGGSSSYTIILGGASFSFPTSCAFNVSSVLNPNSRNLFRGANQTVSWELLSYDSQLTYWGWNVSYNGTLVNSSNNTGNAGGYSLYNFDFNETNATGWVSVFLFWGRVNASDECNYSATIYVNNVTGLTGLAGALRSLRTDTGLGDNAFALLALIIITSVVVYASRYTAAGGAVIGIIMAAFLTFVTGWIPSAFFVILTIGGAAWAYFALKRGF